MPRKKDEPEEVVQPDDKTDLDPDWPTGKLPVVPEDGLPEPV